LGGEEFTFWRREKGHHTSHFWWRFGFLERWHYYRETKSKVLGVDSTQDLLRHHESRHGIFIFLSSFAKLA